MSAEASSPNVRLALEQATAELKRLRTQLRELKDARTEPIAIVGIGCRFPGGVRNAETYWELLKQGRDVVGRIPSSRWPESPSSDAPGTRWAGLLEAVDGFDAPFFGITPREANKLDPQHRLLLEVAWEALEDAGLTRTQVSGSRTGVFVGITSHDYQQELLAGPRDQLDAYSLTGTDLCFASGRISYVLGLQGPSLSIDTACSSSLVAIHLACSSLRAGESQLALAGGVNLILSEQNMGMLGLTHALSPDGRCKTFDARANGYVRGEGCGMVVLKRLSDARRDGDQIWAVIRGSAVNQDGRSMGFAAPNLVSQIGVIRAALQNAGVQPSQIGYVEAHGTGTPLGDPIEVTALTEALGQPRPEGATCGLGSAKTNLGHLEAAAGVAGLIKAVLALKNQEIPAHLHLQTLNPRITLDNTPFYIPTHPQPWPATSTPRRAGVSAFGMSGTNAHLVLEEAPVLETTGATRPARPWELITLSALHPQALQAVAAQLRTHLEAHPALDLPDIALSLSAGRTHFSHRLALPVRSREALLSALSGLGEKPLPSGGAETPRGAQPPARLAFLFTGQGAQYPGMGKDLFDSHPVFRQALERCARLLDPLLDRPLLSVMFAAPGTPEAALLDQTGYTQPALFALEVSLFHLWTSWGLRPELVLGHSVGELAAAYAAGVFSLEDGARLVAARGRLMQALPAGGAMVSIQAPEAAVAEQLLPFAARVSIAAVNGPKQTVISGAELEVLEVAASFERVGVPVSRLAVSHAFHSPLMQPMLEAFAQVAGAVTYQVPRVALVSNLDGRRASTELTSPTYWVRHVREAVRFQAGMQALQASGANTYLELGPRPTLLGLGMGCLSDAAPGTSPSWLPSLRKGADAWATLLGSLGTLYALGLEVDWNGFAAPFAGQRVRLPSYPFQRQSYWLKPGRPATPQGLKTGDSEATLEPKEQPRDASLQGPGIPSETASPATSNAGDSLLLSDNSAARTTNPPSTVDGAAASAIVDTLRKMPPSLRASRLQVWLQQQVAGVLGYADPTLLDPRRGFFELGADSLMAMQLATQLQKDLGLSLATSVTFDHPNLLALTDHLLPLLALETPLEEAVPSPSQAMKPALGPNDPIAIIGLGCRLPGGVTDAASLWRLLEEGIDAVGPIPPDRWDAESWYDANPDAAGKMYVREGAFIPTPDQFDAPFFGISPREAVHMDPQHRVLLEVAWEALENAGVVPASLKNSRTGAFVGIGLSDYMTIQREQVDVTDADAYLGSGTMNSFSAGRLSYLLGLQGPSLAVDTACSSSLVAIHLACHSLRSGECDLALAGGVQLVLSPVGNVYLCRTKALAPDGRCKSFSAKANGYGRGEGCGVIVLKRLQDAQAAGDNILAVIRGSAVNHDGRTSGMTVPNGTSQQTLIRQALKSAGLSARDVQYVEAHGTGTPLGDPIEVEALAGAYGPGRTAESPLHIGSIKANIGHLESAAGVAGVIKAVLALRQGIMPRQVHADQPSPHIRWSELPISLVREARPWAAGEQPRRAGVSSFGFSGTNAHIILEEAPLHSPRAGALPSQENAALQVELPVQNQLVTLSGTQPNAINVQAARLREHLLEHADLSVQDVSFSLSTARSHFAHRLVLEVASRESLLEGLAELARGELPVGCLRGNGTVQKGRLAFLFTGQGSQYAGMGQALYRQEPVFRQALSACATILDQWLDQPLLSVMFADPKSPEASRLHQTGYTQPALFALEYALYQLWTSWGLTPDLLLGHSVGELVAACVAGVFSLEDGLRLVAARGRLMQALPSGGAMVSLQAPEAEVLERLAPFAETVSIAALNAPLQTVISGAEAAVLEVAEAFESSGVKCDKLTVSHAFHSPLMTPMLADLRNVAATVTYHPPRLALLSSVSGALATEAVSTPEYWVDQVRAAVRFADGMRTLHEEGSSTYLELGPRPILVGLGSSCLPAEAEPTWLPSLRPGRADRSCLLSSLGRYYVQGGEVNWAAFHATSGGKRVELPSYPFQRTRCWLPPSQKRLPTAAALGSTKGRFPLSGLALSLPGDVYHHILPVGTAYQPGLADHVVFGKVVVPGAFYLAVVLAVLADRWQVNQATLEDVQFIRPLVLDGETRMHVMLTATAEGARFVVATEGSEGDPEPWRVHAEGTALNKPTRPSTFGALTDAQAVPREPLPVTDIFDRLAGLNVAWGEGWRWLNRAEVDTRSALLRLEAPEGKTLEDGPLPPALIDNSFAGSLAYAMARGHDTGDTPQLPFALKALRWYANAQKIVWCQSVPREVTPDSVPGTTVTDLILWDDAGGILAELEGFVVKRAPRDVFLKLGETVAETPLHTSSWEPWRPGEEEATHTPTGHWLVLASSAQEGQALRDRLQAAGATTSLAVFGPLTDQGPETLEVLDVSDPAASRRWFREAARGRTVQGVVAWWERQETASSPTSQSLEQAVAGLHIAQGTQALGEHQLPPRVWWVTSGAQTISSEERPDLATAPLWGLGRGWLMECPEWKGRLVDLDPRMTAEARLEALWHQLCRTDGEAQAVIRDGICYGARLVKATIPSEPAAITAESYRLEIRDRGAFDKLELMPTLRRAPEPGQVELEVEASGLNFRDVINVLGSAGDLGPLGGECAGVVVRVGERVTHLAVGDRVVALADWAYSRYVTLDARLVARRPEGMTASQAATIPVAFLTAWLGLFEYGKLEAGQRVLIHSAAGGVGMAAVQLALMAGAEVYGTASPSKQDLVRGLGVSHLSSSRNLDFVNTFQEASHGQGLHLVLNALTGGFVDASLSLLAPGGRFMEMGKTDLRQPEEVARAWPGVHYQPFDLAFLARDNPDRVLKLLQEVVALFDSGKLNTLPVKAFPITEAASAFRYMAQARHIGKLVLLPARASQKTLLPPESTVLITGGLGSLGQRVAHWLIQQHGVTHLLLTTHRTPSTERLEAVERLRQSGATVTVEVADVADREALETVLSRIPADRPLRGVIHAAGTLDDGSLSSMDQSRFAKVMTPKAQGAWNLHGLLEGHPLEFFILFSSVASYLGSAGQANYASANGFLDALAWYRRAQGMPATTINWGAWAEGGMAATVGERTRQHWASLGIREIETEQGLSMLERAVRLKAAQVIALPINWLTLQANRHKAPVVLGEVAPVKRQEKRPRGEARGSELPRQLMAVDRHQRPKLMRSALQGLVARVLGLSSSDQVDASQPLSELGLDSLMAVELKNLVSEAVGRPLPATFSFDHPTLDHMGRFLLESALPPEALSQEAPGQVTETPSKVEDASPEQLAQPTPADVEETTPAPVETSSPSVTAVASRPAPAAQPPSPPWAPGYSQAPAHAQAPGQAASSHGPLHGASAPLDQAVAIIGMGCRFPGGAQNPEAFWKLLEEGRDAIGEVPPDRWDIDAYFDPDPYAVGKMVTRSGGFIPGIERFDATFFSIRKREACTMDPQQRLLLEVTWEALEDAGLAVDQLMGSQTGVFVGICTDDYGVAMARATGDQKINAYTGTGNAYSVAAGRLSYIFGFQGPSMALDTACSSSLVALHLACQSLREGECDLAVVAGVNAMLTPETTLYFSHIQALAPDGRCKTFDARADGYSRAEGCGVVVLKRLPQALADQDRVRAVVRGSAVNQDGRSYGLTAPHGPAQEAVIRQALRRAGVAPARVDYVEAHGTGTSLGDPIELQALGAVLGEGRSPGRPVIVGSVKTNIGHAEGAAGVAGVIKTVLALEHGTIPQHLHFNRPSPHIPWQRLPIRIPTERLAWTAEGQPRVAGVSSFGISGTNAHVILEESPRLTLAARAEARPLQLLTLSARSHAALRELAARLSTHLASHPDLPLEDVCYSANTGRSHFAYRLAVVSEEARALEKTLAAFAQGAAHGPGLLEGSSGKSEAPGLVFLLGGVSPRAADNHRILFETQPAFREVLTQCDRLGQDLGEGSLIARLFPESSESAVVGRSAIAQFALEYGLAMLWRTWGVQPEVVAGHGVGTFVAAVLSGVFSLEIALKLMVLRDQSGNAIGHEPAASLRQGQARSLLRLHPPRAPGVELRDARTGESLMMRALEAEFWLDQLWAATGPGAVATDKLGDGIVLELTLEEPGQDDPGVAHRGPASASRSNTPSASRADQIGMPQDRIVWARLLERLGHLYVRGVRIDWKGFDAPYPRRKVVLPTYPFQRKRYWFDEL